MATAMYWIGMCAYITIATTLVFLGGYWGNTLFIQGHTFFGGLLFILSVVWTIIYLILLVQMMANDWEIKHWLEKRLKV